MVPVARLNLLADKARFVASISGVAFAVTLILLVQGLYAGYRDAFASFIERLPADVWVLQATTYDLFHATSTLPDDTAQKLAPMRGVGGVLKVRGRQVNFQAGDRELYSMLLAFEPGPADAQIAGAIGLESLPGAGEMYISKYVRSQADLHDGDEITISGVKLTIKGGLDVKSPPIGSFSLINYADAERVMTMPGQLSYLLVTASDGTSADDLRTQIEKGVGGTSVYTRQEFADVNSRYLQEFLPVIGVLLVVSYLVGTAIASLTIYTVTIERTREFGVLKAIGASNAYVYRLVLFQSLFIALLGFIIGAPISLALSEIAERRVAEFITSYELVAALGTLVAVIVMGLLAALLPVRRVAGIEPANIFRA